MDAKVALQELEELAQKLGVTVSYDRFTGEGMGPGGLCKVKGKWRVIVDRRAAPTERVAVLARALGRFDLETHFISPSLRQLIEKAVARREEAEQAQTAPPQRRKRRRSKAK